MCAKNLGEAQVTESFKFKVSKSLPTANFKDLKVLNVLKVDCGQGQLSTDH